MTEITRVPLQPIAKGVLPKLWIGIAALVLVAGGVAWAAIPAAVDIQTLTAGEGAMPTSDDVALINYKGTLADGTEFDKGEQAVFPLSGGLIEAFIKALEQMQRGGKYKVEIPSELAYGDQQMREIPANSDLTFEIELLDFVTRAEFEQQQQMMRQLQQMQGEGGPPGPPHGAIPPQP